MIQGDEPMVTPEMINAGIKPLIESDEIQISNLMERIETQKEHEDPAEVKVVVDINNNAMYFLENQSHLEKKGLKMFQCLNKYA